MEKDLLIPGKGTKQFANYPFLKNVAFALEEFSIYSEVIISEWKMFVQEGKALRSVESNLTHMLPTPLDSSAQHRDSGEFCRDEGALQELPTCTKFIYA